VPVHMITMGTDCLWVQQVWLDGHMVQALVTEERGDTVTIQQDTV
jgi:hypothetical protein